MWGRLRRARIRRHSEVRLRIERRDPILAPAMQRARPAPSGLRRLGQMIRQVTRGGVAGYWRDRSQPTREIK